MRRPLIATWGILQGVFLALLVALLVLLLLPRLTPIDVLVVRGGSMEPVIHLGAAVVVDGSDRTPVVGAVAVFDDPQHTLVTHRIVGLEGGLILTKGDANSSPDQLHRAPAAMVGTVLFSIPWLGYLLYVLEQPLVFAVLLVGAGGALVLGQLRTILDEVRKMQRRHADATLDRSGDV